MAISASPHFLRPRHLLTGLAVIVSLTLLPTLAEAACTDPAQPGVEWARCQMSQRPFPHAHLSGATLIDTNFQRSDLSGADLSNVYARGATFISSTMKGANLKDADLRSSDLTKAVLDGSDLTGADLRYTRLFRASLRDVNLTGARLDRADLLKADFSGATWTDGKTICAEGSIGQCNPTEEIPADGSAS